MTSGRAALDSNPFDDPSVQSAMHGEFDDDLESNPLDTDSLHRKPGNAYAEPFDEDEEEMYPTSTHGTAPAHAMRDDDVARRERELEERERELDARTEHMRRFGRNNWPPFYPLVYHDIDAEIPPDAQETMRHLYYLWLVFTGTLIWNVPTMVIMATTSVPNANFIGAIVYLIFLPVLSFTLWYRPVYNGLMKEHSLFYYVYFLFGGFHLLFSLYAVVGYASTGCAGFLSVISAFYHGKWLGGAFALVSSLGFLLQGAGNLWYYRVVRIDLLTNQIYQHNQEKGHTFAQAKAELASHGARAYLYVYNAETHIEACEDRGYE
ncbi:hypothetical protein MYAM1_003302 [Malassezia yamatoensis]|uniref:Scamp-domain-containing protein n=1 Tax=Malassezia yamatoensis TaxID=253288 RepID=A0AAJ5YZS9_9BASI|nr:hypothetical protein MYAM1_003302 [Malassezia yamatoensis]